jgi:hypothetical protein
MEKEKAWMYEFVHSRFSFFMFLSFHDTFPEWGKGKPG